MGEAIKLQETDIEETIKSEEKEMEKAINLEETDMEETIKSQDDDIEQITELMKEITDKFNEIREEDMEETVKSQEDGIPIPPNAMEDMDKRKKEALKYYSDPYKSNIDPGVPAPLRLYWRDIDENTKNKYPTAIECYWDGQFYFRRFLKWKEKHRRAYIELSWENKKINIWELNKCYKTNGELSGWKLGEL